MYTWIPGLYTISRVIVWVGTHTHAYAYAHIWIIIGFWGKILIFWALNLNCLMFADSSFEGAYYLFYCKLWFYNEMYHYCMDF